MTNMDAIALKALRESIAHWERNVAAETPEDVRLGAENCACCAAFYDNIESDCIGCPVNEATGEEWCIGTPYDAAALALKQWDRLRTDATRDAWRVAAQAMLDFLRSLLPVESLS